MLSNFLPALADHLWQSTVFALAAGLLTLALRRNHARTRFWVWWITSLKFLIPFSLLVSAGSQFSWPAVQPKTDTPSSSLIVIEQFTQPFAGGKPETATPALLQASAPARMNLMAVLIIDVWFAGFAWLLMRWTLQWNRLRRLAGNALRTDELVGCREVDMLRRLEHEAGIGPLAVVSSATALEPSIFGLSRSVLIWPAALTSKLDEEELEAILLHELSHVRRRDNLASLVPMLVESLFWFHPLVWWMASRLVHERESACDEDVLRGGHCPAAYAEGILKVCEHCLETPLLCAVGITGSDLARRIEDIMQNRVACRLNLVKTLLLIAAAITALTIPLAAGVIHTAVHQAETKLAAAVQPALGSLRGFTTSSQQAHTRQLAQALPGQATRTPAVESKETFEVVSIRPAAPIGPADGGRGGGGGLRGGGGGSAPVCPPAPAGGVQMDAGRITLRNVTTYRLIALAYGIHCRAATEMDLITGLPEWAKTNRFDIQATLPAETPRYTAQQVALGDAPKVMRMLQNLLADRFALTLRRSSKEAPVYNLVVAQPGKIKLSDDQTQAPPPPPLSQATNPIVPVTGAPMFRGGFSLMVDPPAGKVMLEARAIPLAVLINFFQGRDGRFVVDKTGMKGLYDIPQTTLDVGPFDISENAVSVWPEIMRGLGLKLEPARGPVETLIIERVEKPSEN